MQQNMIKRLRPAARRMTSNKKVFCNFPLPDILIESRGTERNKERLIG
jgi:hypothetical protein